MYVYIYIYICIYIYIWMRILIFLRALLHIRPLAPSPLRPSPQGRVCDGTGDVRTVTAPQD